MQDLAEQLEKELAERSFELKQYEDAHAQAGHEVCTPSDTRARARAHTHKRTHASAVCP